MRNVQPIGSNVVIEIVEIQLATTSGITVVGAKEQRAKLIAVGAGCTALSQADVGKFVEFSSGHLFPKEVDGVLYMIGSEDAIKGLHI